MIPTLAILLPGLGALLASLTYALPAGSGHARRRLDDIAILLTTLPVVASCVLAWWLFLQPGEGAAGTIHWLNWIEVAGWKASFGAQIDPLTTTMLIVVTTVSACVHVYSIGYMHDDPSRRRFFIYLSLFTLAMLLLVSAPNLLQMFLGWEGVGVCSYLLIGFWHQKPSASAAAIKAFVVNRVADCAMLVGLFLLLMNTHTLTYTEIFAKVAELASNSPQTLNLIALLIFIGAMGKSAQFGLHTWLPDAMEGPTPVSALIHAATMVTAGVFLLCRLSPLYEAAPDVLTVVAIVGALTAIFAATIGLTQTDIKRVIAYSTCSQLGYMFFAIGASAYPAAMFHLTTHAFFKALLFLGAGSVIHAMHHEQNIFKMGALKTILPITYGLMWVGSLALAGIPPFAGFFSKDLILDASYMAPGSLGAFIYAVGTLAAFLTAIYGFRIIFMAFHGPVNYDAHHHHPHPEITKPLHFKPTPANIMLLAMVPLAVGAILAGMLLKGMSHLGWWQGSIAIAEGHTGLEGAHHSPLLVHLLPGIVGACGIYLSYYLFDKHRAKAKQLARVFVVPYRLSLNKWYIDEIYDVIWVRPTAYLARMLFRVVDGRLIDGLVNFSARTVWDFGVSLRATQTGYVYHYGFVMLLALALGLAYLLWGTLS